MTLILNTDDSSISNTIMSTNKFFNSNGLDLESLYWHVSL